MKKYAEDDSLQIAMTEYNELNSVNDEVWTEDNQYIGKVSQIYDNTSHSGEQVYAVDPLDNDFIIICKIKFLSGLYSIL